MVICRNFKRKIKGKKLMVGNFIKGTNFTYHSGIACCKAWKSGYIE